MQKKLVGFMPNFEAVFTIHNTFIANINLLFLKSELNVYINLNILGREVIVRKMA